MRHVFRALATALLLAQLFSIFYARRATARYFCWAPFDRHTSYRVEAMLNGRALSAEEIEMRYRRPQEGTDFRSFQNLVDIFEGVEDRRPDDPEADIILHYSINGGPEQTWRHPAER